MQKWMFPLYSTDRQIRAHTKEGHGSTGRYLPDLQPRNRPNPRQTTDGVPPQSITAALLSSVPNQIHTQRERALHPQTRPPPPINHTPSQKETPKSALPAPTHQMDSRDQRNLRGARHPLGGETRRKDRLAGTTARIWPEGRACGDGLVVCEVGGREEGG